METIAKDENYCNFSVIGDWAGSHVAQTHRRAGMIMKMKVFGIRWSDDFLRMVKFRTSE